MLKTNTYSPFIRRYHLLHLSTLTLVLLPLLLTGCVKKSQEEQLADAAAAINTAIEENLSLNSFEYASTSGAYLNETKYEQQKTTYIGIRDGEQLNYYITEDRPDSSLNVEHLLLGADCYARLTDKKTEKTVKVDEVGVTDPVLYEKGWRISAESDQKQSDYYKEWLWIYKNRIRPEDFGTVTKSKEGDTVTYLLKRNDEQFKQPLLITRNFYEQMNHYFEDRLSEEELTEKERTELEAERQRIEEAYHSAEAATPRTYEALEASVDKEGRLLSIRYEYDSPSEGQVTPEGNELKSFINYFLIELKQAENDSISFPE